MSIQTVGLKAYNAALKNFAAAERRAKSAALPAEAPKVNEFSNVLRDSLKKVNDLQVERSNMVTSFAAGENQNVHELMISLQKASLAMNMTAAVRNKVMEAYKELSRMQF
ncbi:MAG: flagellar hook-basal body complex protein FliE [Desulfovibrio sp.]|jgi:flagellar hook-basal body complex protein FliE|nr:flagellar hook-basal body complex protein FliE [Desulfovibrio sp.]